MSTDTEVELPDSNPSSPTAGSIKLTVSQLSHLKIEDEENWINIYKAFITMPGI